jgi:general secretion pathway protein D
MKFGLALAFAAVVMLVSPPRALGERVTVAPAGKDDKPAPEATTTPTTERPPGEEEFLGCKKYPAEKRFKWSIRGEVGASELAASLGQISCLPIVLASGVASRSGKVALEVPDLVTAPEVYRLFYAALEALGLTVDPAGGVLRIVDVARGKEVAEPSLGGALVAPNDDRFVVRLYRPHHVTPSELSELFGRLKSKEGDVSVFGAASLVIIDRASNVRRMEALGRALDVAEAQSRIYTLPTHGQTPTDLAASIEKILTTAAHKPVGDKGKAPGGSIDPDVQALVPVDNARLVAMVGNDDGWRRVQAIAERLDPAGEDFAQSQGHVISLSHTNAEDMTATLQQVGLARSGTSTTASRPGTPGAPSAAAPTATGGLPFSGDVRIAADKTSNSLVVFANGADFNLVRDLVSKLDVPRRQVYVEAVIFDLSVDKERSLGVVFHQGAATTSGSATGFAISGSSALNSVDVTTNTIGAALGGGGLLAGVFGSSFSFMGQSFPSFGVMLQALEQDKDVDVISQPHILTMDNTKASISVGQNIVFKSADAASATIGLTTTYTRIPVALTLELTPHLNESDAVRLEINGTIEDVADSSTTSVPGGPTTNERKLSTAVVIKDGETVVLGGLQKESESETVSKIPFLGDIPLLGRLFSTHGRSRVKQDLLIVLTPYIIRGPQDLRRIQERKENERRDFLERYSAFKDDSQFEAHVDYRRKRGLLAEIEMTAAGAEREAEAVRAAEKALRPRPTAGVISIEAQ